MAKTKTSKKKYNPNKNGIGYSEKRFLFSQDDSDALTVNVYLRLLDFKAGTAVPADRTTLMIRLHAGVSMLEHFEHDGVEEVLVEALRIVKDTRVKDAIGLRGFTPEHQHIVGLALAFIHQMFDQTDLWLQAKAVKLGEDRCLIGADKYEYVLIKMDEE